MKKLIPEIRISYSGKQTESQKITNSRSVFNVFYRSWSQKTIEIQEEFKVLLLNNANEVLGIFQLSKGGMKSTTVDIKLIFTVVVKTAACGIILCHNHPSGALRPSNADILITSQIKSAANIFSISLLDHIIITKKGYYSFSDNGLIIQNYLTDYATS